MTQRDGWPKIAVVGAGAVGGYFGGALARAGAPVVMIGRPAFVQAVSASGLFLDTLHFQEVVPVEASSDLGAARGADIVLFCVKTTDTAQTARELAPFLTPGTAGPPGTPGTLVVSCQNGVDNVAQIRAASGIDAIPAVVYVAASVPEPGRVKHLGRGDLVVGPRSQETLRLAATFARAHVPCRISDNVEGELWTKLVWNCALNAVSALGGATYGRIAASAGARRVLVAVVDEVLAVADASNVRLAGLDGPEAAHAGVLKIASQMAETISSMAQDMSRGKRTEIESLNGFIVRRGAELGVATPVNQTLYALVKLAEVRGLEWC